MTTKFLLLGALSLGLTLSVAKAQFTDGRLALDASNVETVGTVLYAANFDGGSNSVTINSVDFVGTNQVDGTYQGGNFSITGAGGLDGTGGGTAAGGTDSNASAAYQTLNENGLYYQTELTLNNLTVNQTYSVQLIVDAQTGDDRYQQYDDLTNGQNSALTYAGGAGGGAAYITEVFTATATSETLQAQYGGGQGAQLSGFVLETAPEPSTWALMGLSLAGLLYLARRPLARS
jgi:hypothetical protein